MVLKEREREKEIAKDKKVMKDKDAGKTNSKVALHPESRLIKFGLNDDFVGDDFNNNDVNKNKFKINHTTTVSHSNHSISNSNSNTNSVSVSSVSNATPNTYPYAASRNSVSNQGSNGKHEDQSSNDLQGQQNMSPIDDDNNYSPLDMPNTDTIPKKVKTGPKKKVSWAPILSTDSFFLKDEPPKNINMPIEEVEKIQERIREDMKINTKPNEQDSNNNTSTSSLSMPNLQQSNQQFINFQSKIFNLQSISNFEKNLYKNSKD